MITMEGRDPAWAARTMAAVFGRATELNLTPLQWEIGLFVLRDLIHGKKWPRDQRTMHWRQVRPETVWGCPVKVIGIEDTVILVVSGTMAGREGSIHRFEAKE